MDDAPGAEPHALFVYGTLKRGQLNGPLLAPYRRSVEPAWTRGHLYDLGLFPALVRGEGTVQGEIVRLAAADLARVLPILDQLEDYRPNDAVNSIYLRRVIDVWTASGEHERAYAYCFNRDHTALPRVASGRWFGSAANRAPSGGAEGEAFQRHLRISRQRQDPTPDDTSSSRREDAGKRERD